MMAKKLNDNIISAKMFESVYSKRWNYQCSSICSLLRAHLEQHWIAQSVMESDARVKWATDGAFNSNEQVLSKESLLNKENFFIDCLSPWPNFCCSIYSYWQATFFYDERNMGNIESLCQAFITTVFYATYFFNIVYNISLQCAYFVHDLQFHI